MVIWKADDVSLYKIQVLAHNDNTKYGTIIDCLVPKHIVNIVSMLCTWIAHTSLPSCWPVLPLTILQSISVYDYLAGLTVASPCAPIMSMCVKDVRGRARLYNYRKYRQDPTLK